MTEPPSRWPDHRVQYVPCRGCGHHCVRSGEATQEQPCWGTVLFEILPAAPDCAVPSTHLCAGHAEPGSYVPLRLAPVDQAFVNMRELVPENKK